jgi:phosphatidate cytidylyltransferase
LFGAIFVTVINDVSALFVGQSLGKHPLAKNISPGKTVEGFIGGAVVSIVLAYAILPEIHPWTHTSALVVGVALAIVVPVGDLFESMVKRTLGVKDMGELLPGHGGMLDRVDGLLFALPTTYYLVHIFHLG